MGARRIYRFADHDVRGGTNLPIYSRLAERGFTLENMMALIEAQQREVVRGEHIARPGRYIGGECLRFEVDASGVTYRLVRDWAPARVP